MRVNIFFFFFQSWPNHKPFRTNMGIVVDVIVCVCVRVCNWLCSISWMTMVWLCILATVRRSFANWTKFIRQMNGMAYHEWMNVLKQTQNQHNTRIESYRLQSAPIIYQFVKSIWKSASRNPNGQACSEFDSCLRLKWKTNKHILGTSSTCKRILSEFELIIGTRRGKKNQIN